MTEYTEEQILRAKNLANEFAVWVRKNPDLWQLFIDEAARIAVSGARVSSKYLVERLRAKDYVDSWGNDANISNDLTPLVARKLCDDCPELRPYMIFHHSVFDEV